jgi:DNA (cytosine-5)-methyltransferase 1
MGFRDAGFKIAGAVEIDQDAATAFHLNVGVMPIVKDIRDVRGGDLLTSAGLQRGQLTLLFGCPPCQSFTVLRRGAELTPHDRKRNALVHDYLRLVEELHPRHLAFENVPGLVTGRWRPLFDRFLNRLTALGYTVEWKTVDAAIYGVPQRRRRVLVIGSRVTTPQLPKVKHCQHGCLEHAPFVTVRDTIAHLRPLDSGEQDPDDELHRARRHGNLTLKRLAHIPEGGARMDLPDPLILDCHRNHDGHYDIYGRMWWDRVAPTLTSGCTNVTRGRFAHPEQHRAITLREAMLLQSFPSYARLYGGAERMALQVGNAVPALVTEHVGKAIKTMERRSRRKW